MKKLQPIAIYLPLAFLFILFLSTGCSKTADTTASTVPTITSYPSVSLVTTTSAQAYGVTTNYGVDALALTATGYCWSATNQTPTTADAKTSNGLDSLVVTANLVGLTPNTTYYARAYASNTFGTGYSPVVTFKTNSATATTTATVSTLAGNLNADYINGTGTAAAFKNPQGVCADAAGNIYVADTYNNVIRKITPLGVTTTYAGTGTIGYVDGPSATAQFYAPKGLAIDAAGTLYVADMGNNIIRKISALGVVSTLAGRGNAGYADGTGTAAVFKSPSGLAVDAGGNVFVADKGNNMIRQITPAGVVTVFAGNAAATYIDATGTAAGFNAPAGVTVDATGNLYVADGGNYSIRKITSAGVVSTLIGSPYFRTVVPAATDIRVNTAGALFITDAGGRIMELVNNKLFPLAGSVNTTGFANGVNIAAAFNSPQALTLDASGNVYVADMYNNMIRKIVITTTP